jgi:hypothetical protein
VTPTISYVIPVHNNASSIASVVRRVAERIAAHPGSEVVLIENASTDASAAVIEGLADTLSTERVTVLACRSAKGIGCAWRVGIPRTTGELVVLTASDLPFGFSDLDGALRLQPRPPLLIGSKAHPSSVLEVDRLRKMMSRLFRVVRGLLLGLWQGDTQGSLLISGPLLRELAPDLGCADYLVATEIIAEGVRRGVTPVEVPITYPRQDQRSTVSPLRDSLRMLAGLVRLRRRLHRRRTAGRPRSDIAS